jgi:hypothetical protein
MLSAFGNSIMTDQTTPYQCDSRSYVLLPLTLTIALGIGTGGSLTTEYCRHRKDGIIFQGINSPVAGHHVATQAADLSRIKNALKLTVGEIAECVGVSRQSVYNWKSGSEIKAQHAAKLENLKKAADVILASHVDVPAFSLQRKLPEGRTLLETVSMGGDGRLTAHSLLQMLNEESVQRRDLDERFAGRKQSHNNNTFGV